MEAHDSRRMNLLAYLDLSRTSEERWEYVNGEAFVMAASPEHNVVKRNVLTALVRALEGQPCRPMPDGQKVSTPRTGAYHFPDASVFCQPPLRDANDPHALTNPTLLVEVLSETTQDYDRGGKFKHYRTLDTFEEYLLISVTDRTVERHRRLPTGEWLMTEIRAGDVELVSVGVTLQLSALWVDLEWIQS